MRHSCGSQWADAQQQRAHWPFAIEVSTLLGAEETCQTLTIFVLSQNKEENISHVLQVLQRVLQNCRYLKAEKCELNITAPSSSSNVMSGDRQWMQTPKLSLLPVRGVLVEKPPTNHLLCLCQLQDAYVSTLLTGLPRSEGNRTIYSRKCSVNVSQSAHFNVNGVVSTV